MGKNLNVVDVAAFALLGFSGVLAANPTAANAQAATPDIQALIEKYRGEKTTAQLKAINANPATREEFARVRTYLASSGYENGNIVDWATALSSRLQSVAFPSGRFVQEKENPTNGGGAALIYPKPKVCDTSSNKIVLTNDEQRGFQIIVNAMLTAEARASGFLNGSITFPDGTILSRQQYVNALNDNLAGRGCATQTPAILPNNNTAITPTPPVQPINPSTIIPHTLPPSEAEICNFRSGVTANGMSGQVAGNTGQGSLSVGFTTSSTQYTEGTNNVLDATGRGFQAAAKLTEKAMALYEQGKTEEGDAMLARAGNVRGTWLKCPEQELETKTIPKIPAKEGEGKGGAGTIAEPKTPSNKIEVSPVPNDAAVPGALDAFKAANAARMDRYR